MSSICQDLHCITYPACADPGVAGWDRLYFVPIEYIESILYEAVNGLRKGLISDIVLKPGRNFYEFQFENQQTGLVFDSESPSGTNGYNHTVTATLDFKDSKTRASIMNMHKVQFLLVAVAKDAGRIMSIGTKRAGAILDVNSNTNGSTNEDQNIRTVTFTLSNDEDQIEVLRPAQTTDNSIETRREETFDWLTASVNCGVVAGTTNCEPGDEALAAAWDFAEFNNIQPPVNNGNGTVTWSLPAQVVAACCEDPVNVAFFNSDQGTNLGSTADFTTDGVGVASVALNGQNVEITIPDTLDIDAIFSIQGLALIFSACGQDSYLMFPNFGGGSQPPANPPLPPEFEASFVGLDQINVVGTDASILFRIRVQNSGCPDATINVQSITTELVANWTFQAQTVAMPPIGQSADILVEATRDISPNSLPIDSNIMFNLTTTSCGGTVVEVPLQGCDFGVGTIGVNSTGTGGAYNAPLDFTQGVGTQALIREFKIIGDNCCESTIPQVMVTDVNATNAFTGTLQGNLNVNALSNSIQIEYNDSLPPGNYIVRVQIDISPCNGVEWFIPVNVLPA